jgi:uncharacterized membrane protein
MARHRAVLAIIVLTVSWSAALAAAPGAGSSSHAGGRTFAAAVYVAGSFICHQRPERSFHIDNVQLPVCARCVGLYVGAAVGALGWAVIAGLGRSVSARARWWQLRVRAVLAMAAIPTLLSIATAWLGVWDPGNTGRALLALPLGAAAGGLVAAVAARDLE